jgi:hypothetical protein
MKSSDFDQGPPEGNWSLAELRQALLTDVSQRDAPAKITELAEELQEKLAAAVTPTSSEIRRPRK